MVIESSPATTGARELLAATTGGGLAAKASRPIRARVCADCRSWSRQKAAVRWAGREQIGVGHERSDLAAVRERGRVPPSVFDGLDQGPAVAGMVARKHEAHEADEPVVVEPMAGKVPDRSGHRPVALTTRAARAMR